MKQKIFSASSIWPLKFFPNRIIIDDLKITIEYYLFFWTRRVIQLSIDDIQSIDVMHGPISSTLRIEPRGYFEKPLPPVKHLPNKMASKARKIIMKLLLAD